MARDDCTKGSNDGTEDVIDHDSSSSPKDGDGEGEEDKDGTSLSKDSAKDSSARDGVTSSSKDGDHNSSACDLLARNDGAKYRYDDTVVTLTQTMFGENENKDGVKWRQWQGR